MVVAGDEIGRTQNGNNNPYNIDSVATWTNYAMAGTNAPTRVPTGDGGSYHDNLGQALAPDNRNPIFVLATYLMRLRRAHPALQQSSYAEFLENEGDRVTYSFRREDGVSFPFEGNRALMLRIDGSAIGDADFILLINMHDETVHFQVPPADSTHAWRRLVDTAIWAESDGNCWDRAHAQVVSPGDYGVHPSSVVVLSAG
jgi:glycogen operon protein